VKKSKEVSLRKTTFYPKKGKGIGENVKATEVPVLSWGETIIKQSCHKKSNVSRFKVRVRNRLYQGGKEKVQEIIAKPLLWWCEETPSELCGQKNKKGDGGTSPLIG